MEIREHRLLLFIELYREHFGVLLGRDEAHEKALLLINYAKLFISPVAKIDRSDITG